MLVLVLVFALACGACSSMPYLRLAADEEPYALWMAALKGFEGPVYYLGGDETYSYFRAGTIFYTPYKARTDRIRLPRTFPVGQGQLYRVTQEMVPQYDPNAGVGNTNSFTGH